GPGIGLARGASAAGPDARRRDEVRCVSTVEERQRSRRSRAAETLRAPGGCWRMRRRSSSTMLRHRCPPRSLPPPRKPRARGPSQYPDRLLVRLELLQVAMVVAGGLFDRVTAELLQERLGEDDRDHRLSDHA